MTRKKVAGVNKKIIVIILTAALLTTMISPVFAAHEELSEGKYYSLINEDNQVILQTARQVYVGDEYITADNNKFRIEEISENTARCVFAGRELMPEVSYDYQNQAWVLGGEAVPAAGGKPKTVAIYHTHSDESYDPSDGTSSKEGSGGIYDVGEALAVKLRDLGFKVDHNKNNHNPHDVNAYNRSRRTAATLLRNNPDVILDVHRDAVPASQYKAEVNGQSVTKVKLVVGKSNPNQASSLEFAKKIKAVMDKKAPGLSNGIFIGKGDYNQDLSPQAMLIEVGSNTNTKEDAERGVQIFAETLPSVLGVASGAGNSQSGGPAAKPLAGAGRGVWTNVLILVVVVALAGIGFYYLNRGTVKK